MLNSGVIRVLHDDMASARVLRVERTLRNLFLDLHPVVHRDLEVAAGTPEEFPSQRFAECGAER